LCDPCTYDLNWRWKSKS